MRRRSRRAGRSDCRLDSMQHEGSPLGGDGEAEQVAKQKISLSVQHSAFNPQTHLALHDPGPIRIVH